MRIAIRGQYPNKGKKELRPDVGTDIRGDEFTIDARKIVKQKPRGKRDVATASKFVRIFRRSRRCPNHRIMPHRPASPMQSSRFQGRIPHPVRIITKYPPLTSGTSVCRTESPSELLFCRRESAMRHAMETLDGKLIMRSARLTVLELAPLKRLGASPLSLPLLCTLRRRLPPHGQCSQNRGVPPSSGDIP